jgi:UDP-N-acetylglucosamine transferase subunit ALG13
MKELEGMKAVVVASTGGHLYEALLNCERLKLSPHSLVITHETPQSRSVLKNVEHAFIPPVDSRDLRGAIAAAPEIIKILKDRDYDVILSTGAAIAVSALPAHIFLKKPFYYFESLTRFTKPSLTGKILQYFPTVRRYSSNAINFGPKWNLSPSLLEVYKVKEKSSQSQSLKILVTLGTIPNYRFDRLVDDVLRIIDKDDEIHWQLGCTSRSNLPGRTYETISNNDLVEMARGSDVVISHCGIGTVLELLSNGICPLVMPREKVNAEHVDNHQIEAIQAFTDLNLISVFRPGLTRSELISASKKYIE